MCCEMLFLEILNPVPPLFWLCNLVTQYIYFKPHAACLGEHEKGALTTYILVSAERAINPPVEGSRSGSTPLGVALLG